MSSSRLHPWVDHLSSRIKLIVLFSVLRRPSYLTCTSAQVLIAVTQHSTPETMSGFLLLSAVVDETKKRKALWNVEDNVCAVQRAIYEYRLSKISWVTRDFANLKPRFYNLTINRVIQKIKSASLIRRINRAPESVNSGSSGGKGGRVGASEEWG